MPFTIEQLLYEVRQRFLLRWILANMVGWSVGLYLGVLNPLCFAATGIVAGLVLGASQWWALRGSPLGIHRAENVTDTSTLISQNARRWIGFTFAGAALGLIPAAVLGGVLYLFTSGLAAMVAGAVLGLAVGLGQWMVLKAISQQVVWWLVVNAVGGALCGWLTLMPIIRGLPLGLLMGSALFGYLTGRVLERLIAEIGP